MAKSKFVYVTYIATTVDRLWQALLDAEFTRQYWGQDNISDWKPGSKWEHRCGDGTGTVLIVGKVVENDRPRRLVVTWADPADAANTAVHSRVTFEVEPINKMVRLTVTHDELPSESDMMRKISNGWPRVLSSLKSLLETGKPLDTWANQSTSCSAA